MFNLKKIDTYRDGGTIAIKCVMSVRWKEVKWLEDRQGQEIEICIDGRLGNLPPKFWFGEDLDPLDLDKSAKAAEDCDICIIVGTSMQVFPANQIPFLTKEDCLIYYIDPSDIDFYIDKQRKPFFKHIQEPATIGMQKVIEDIKNV